LLRNSIQHQIYHQQKEKEEFYKFVKLLIMITYINVPFVVIEAIRINFITVQYEFWLSFMYFAVIVCLVYYWLPTKKEYGKWKKNGLIF